jgi:hypothetical protein
VRSLEEGALLLSDYQALNMLRCNINNGEFVDLSGNY